MKKPKASHKKNSKNIQIIIGLIGGFGNQLFQYALGEKLVKQGYDVKYDISFYNDGFRKFRLNHFVDNLQLVDIKSMNFKQRLYLKYRRKKGFCKIMRFLYSKIFSYVIKENLDIVDKRIFNLKKDHFIEGYWSKLIFFDHLREDLQNRISLKQNFYTESFLDYRNQIINSQQPTVSIHIRRTDYLNTETRKVWNNLTNSDYYENAINFIKKNIDKPHFFVFSDDIRWCKQNLKINDTTYIEQKRDMLDVHDFELLKCCSHHINANSTFSWWAAYLNKKPEKIVVVPKHWFIKENMQTRYELGYTIPDNWIKI